jgi:hypothetical protein
MRLRREKGTSCTFGARYACGARRGPHAPSVRDMPAARYACGTICPDGRDMPDGTICLRHDMRLRREKGTSSVAFGDTFPILSAWEGFWLLSPEPSPSCTGEACYHQRFSGRRIRMNIPAGKLSHAEGVYHIAKRYITCRRQISLRRQALSGDMRLAPLDMFACANAICGSTRRRTI